MFLGDGVLDGFCVVLQPNPSRYISSGAVEVAATETPDVRLVRGREERKDHYVNLLALTLGMIVGYLGEGR